MALITKHNRAEHTHENEQFRRVAKLLSDLFLQQQWNGLLIGNPFNENYSRFRADAILLYDHGLLIFDFKNYRGQLRLPPNKREFESTQWYTDSEKDQQRVLIKGGNRFINPFRQICSYREALKEMLENEPVLGQWFNKNRIGAVNIFAGPLTLINQIPGELPFYKICQESELPALLYDYASENCYSEEAAGKLINLFPAEDWQESVIVKPQDTSALEVVVLEEDAETAINNLLASDESGILILEAMEAVERDKWVRYVLQRSSEFEIPQVETWIHSSRIGKRVSNRIGFELQSLYNTIYGGSEKQGDDEQDDLTKEETVPAEISSQDEHLQEVISIRNDLALDDSAVIILHEAHLVSRSLNQSELLRFGTGRLLEDLIKFLDLPGNRRKLICIGDPYSITYGKDSDCALNRECMTELFSGTITAYRKPLATASFSKAVLKSMLANGIDQGQFNSLHYAWVPGELEEISKSEVPALLHQWFTTPLEHEPANGVLVFKNVDAKSINTYIKKHCIGNGTALAPGDLLLLSNNIYIPDDTGLGQPRRLYNGMFLRVESVITTLPEVVHYGKTQLKRVPLTFIQVNAKVLGLAGKPVVQLWLLENYFYGDNTLSKEEQVAFRVFVSKKLAEKRGAEPFEGSRMEQLLLQDVQYGQLMAECKELKGQLEQGDKVKTKLEEKERALRKLIARYKRKHKNLAFQELIRQDPMVNAALVCWGWALTIHKSIGYTYTNVLLNASRGENSGIANADYFRWLYTGITATEGCLRIINPQQVHPLMDLRFEDAEHIVGAEAIENNILLAFPGYVPDSEFTTAVPGTLKEHVRGAICELVLLLKGNGFHLESVTPRSPYLTKAAFRHQQQSHRTLLVAVDNKGERDDWQVSSIRVEQGVAEDKQSVSRLAEHLFATHIRKGLKFPSDFRIAVYQQWKERLQQEGYQLELVETHQNQDVFRAAREQAKATFRVYYTDNGFFTKIALVNKTETTLGDQLKTWLTHGN